MDQASKVRHDQQTGTHYNYFRDYDPAIGRYVQSDPIGLDGGINTYGYVGARPLSQWDSNGLQAIPMPPMPAPGVGNGTSSGNGAIARGFTKFFNRIIEACTPKDDEPKCKFIREVYYSGPTKTCWYQGRGNQFTFAQYKDKPCPPIDPVTCLVDTTGLPNFK